ncbi:hypothetical protein Sste5346_005619 [Sporothrix stenoceras]|uniref:Synaptobrevin n=1 Tax=Sporothrix stenoceras TaxID=5173 RepID=A0ABR3Z3U5_9PEZI
MGRPDPIPPYSASPVPSFSSFSSSTSISYDPFVDLGRLLARLEQNLLRADSDRWRRLVADEFQRLQARFDVAAARKLLTRVEQSALSIKVLSQRQEVQAELNRRRALVELLQERLDNLDEEARAAAALHGGVEDADNSEGEGEGEDDDTTHIIRAPSAPHLSVATQPPAALATDLPTPTSTTDAPTPTSTSTNQPSKPRRKKTNRVRIAAPEDQATTTSPATTTTMTTRSRRKQQEVEADDAASIQTQDTARTTATSLFEKSGDGESSGVATEEAVLDHHRREQEALSEDILRLAKALKEKSLVTSRMLEDDKDVVDRVGEGMNTTTDSLSAASRSMAILTRMTEGKGWWGRMLLLGMVYGSMLALLLLFLFLPKLRL